jgi:hypothetical protein
MVIGNDGDYDLELRPLPGKFMVSDDQKFGVDIWTDVDILPQDTIARIARMGKRSSLLTADSA